MPTPLVTIVVATYKTRPIHLTDALDSAENQTWENREVIVSDDSPTDSLREIVEKYASPKIRYRHNSPSLGVARNHWTCFREAQGEYIAVLNHDDIFEPTFIERLVTPLQNDPDLALAFCDHWTIDDGGNRLVKQTDEMSAFYKRATLSAGVHRPFYELLVSQTIPMVMGSVFRKRFLPEVLPDDAGPSYDTWMTYFLAREGYGAYYIPERLSSWRTHPTNLTNQSGIDWMYGSALCWHSIATDQRLISIRPTARRKAALAFYSCALKSWLAGKNKECFSFGKQSLHSELTWRGIAACCLPAVPKGMYSFLKR